MSRSYAEKGSVNARTMCRAFAALLLAVVSACGDGGSDHRSGPPLPSRSDPAFGAAGNVLVADAGVLSSDGMLDEVWIGFEGKDAWDALVALDERQPATGWICGVIVADARHHLGFYFDPHTTHSGEITAETLQTTLDLLKRPGVPASEAGMNRCIPAVVERLVPTD